MSESPESNSSSQMSRRLRLLAMSLAAIGGVIVSLTIWQTTNFGRSTEMTTRQTGVADIGGPFELITHNGETVTDQDFAGRYMLIYFGFTWCPDVCPLSLQLMGEALDRLGSKAAMIQPLFITVDPERDTPDALKAYVPSFHPDLIGLTGTPEAIAAIAAAYKTYYRKAAPLDPANPLSYGVDHMNIFFLMGPDGTYATHFASPKSPDEIADGIAAHLPKGP